MRTVSALILVLAFGVSATGSASLEDFTPSNGAENVHALADLVRAQGEYVRMLGEARLAVARARLEEAKAAHEWQHARRLWLLVNRLEMELKNLARDEAVARKRIVKITEAGTRLKVIFHGWTSPHVFQGLRVILTNGVSPATAAEIMSAPVEPAPASYFKPNRKGIAAEDFPGGNLGSFLRFLETKNYAVEPWTPPHLILMTSLERIFKESDAQAKELRSFMEEIRKGTLDLWHPPKAKAMDLEN
jgi:hypothetical protein